MSSALIGGVFIVLVIILIAYVKWRPAAAVESLPADSDEVEHMCPARAPPQPLGCDYPERQLYGETSAYYGGCAPTMEAMTNACGENAQVDYAVNDFGAPGVDFKDWAMSQAVGSDVLANHAEFVKDRIKNQSSIITGRTMALGELEGDDVKWMGIRGRPQKVPVHGLMAQQPDFTPDHYADKPKLTWSS